MRGVQLSGGRVADEKKLLEFFNEMRIEDFSWIKREIIIAR